VNQTISSVCWSIVIWIVFVQIPEMIRYISNPFSSTFCFVHLLLKNALVMQATLLFDAAIIVRYLFIFWLKDPFHFQDDFWYLYVNLWILSFSLATQFIYLFLPGCQPLNYSICTGQHQPPCNASIPPKPNYSTLILHLFSISTHIFVTVRLQLHKRKQNQMQTTIEMQNLTDYKTAISNVIIMLVLVLFLVLFNKVQPEKANIFPYYLIVYGCHMFVPFLGIFSICLMYYMRQPKLRRTIYRELVDWIRPSHNET
jgi:hypothetical protein